MCNGKAIAILLLASGIAGCSGVNPFDSDTIVIEGGVRTDSTSYHVLTTDAWFDVTIGVSFLNPVLTEVRIPTCQTPYPPLVEKLGKDGWSVVYSPIVLLCLGVPVRVAPGSEYAMTYRVIAGRGPNSLPRFEVDELAGTYRLNWPALTTKSGSPLPLALRTSNSFQLVE